MTQDIQDICGEVPKVFISHTSSMGDIAGRLKDLLAKLGLSAFLAHEDIKLTAKWKEVIKEEISSADVFLPIFSRDFEESAYCNQELGFAASVRDWRSRVSGRALIITSFKQKGVVPYGFISDEQAAEFTCEADIPPMILDTLFEKDFDLWFKSFICRIRCSPDYATSNNKLAPELGKVEKLTGEQASELVAAVNESDQVYMAWHFMSAIERKIVQCPGIGQISFYYEPTSPYTLPEIQFRIARDDGDEDSLPLL